MGWQLFSGVMSLLGWPFLLAFLYGTLCDMWLTLCTVAGPLCVGSIWGPSVSFTLEGWAVVTPLLSVPWWLGSVLFETLIYCCLRAFFNWNKIIFDYRLFLHKEWDLHWLVGFFTLWPLLCNERHLQTLRMSSGCQGNLCSRPIYFICKFIMCIYYLYMFFLYW